MRSTSTVVASSLMTRVTRAQAQRRRVFAALSIVTVIGLAVIFWPKSSSERPTHPPIPGAAQARVTVAPTASTPPDTVAAWLAWMPGGFPESFRSKIASADGITRNVVVEGDTLWMTESHDAGGAVVDRPPSPYEIPIDAFAVDPSRYAPFLPADQRDAVVGALRNGDAVLGESSARDRKSVVKGRGVGRVGWRDFEGQ